MNLLVTSAVPHAVRLEAVQLKESSAWQLQRSSASELEHTPCEMHQHDVYSASVTLSAPSAVGVAHLGTLQIQFSRQQPDGASADKGALAGAMGAQMRVEHELPGVVVVPTAMRIRLDAPCTADTAATGAFDVRLAVTSSVEHAEVRLHATLEVEPPGVLESAPAPPQTMTVAPGGVSNASWPVQCVARGAGHVRLCVRALVPGGEAEDPRESEVWLSRHVLVAASSV